MCAETQCILNNTQLFSWLKLKRSWKSANIKPRISLNVSYPDFRTPNSWKKFCFLDNNTSNTSDYCRGRQICISDFAFNRPLHCVIGKLCLPHALHSWNPWSSASHNCQLNTCSCWHWQGHCTGGLSQLSETVSQGKRLAIADEG